MKKYVLIGAVACLMGNGAVLAATPAGQTAPALAGAVAATDVFATVDGVVIPASAYQASVNASIRQKFYHGRPDEQKINEVKKEVAQGLIDRVLLIAEAKRRALQPDEQRIRETLAGYEARYKDSAQWQERRSMVLPELQRELTQRSLLEALENSVRTSAEPNEEQLRQHYAANQEMFTPPEQVKLSVIMLKVDPSSPRAAWDKAREEGLGIVKRLQAGADFAALAKAHSADASAEKGGDFGYVHRGRVSAILQAEIDKLQPSEISGAVTVLEGVIIVRVDDRKPAKLRPFEEVRARIVDMWKRDQANRQWTEFVAGLRRAAVVQIDSARFPELGALSPVQQVGNR